MVTFSGSAASGAGRDTASEGRERPAPRWKQRPPGSNWGDFGVDDQLGRLNLITPNKVLQGVAEVREGLSFCLSLPLHFPIYPLSRSRKPPRLKPIEQGGVAIVNRRIDAQHTDVFSDDTVELDLQYSTQWDGFAHAGTMFDAMAEGAPRAVYYNGFRADEDVLGQEGLTGELEGLRSTKLGIEHFAVHGVQGRGVMVDLEAHFGRGRTRIGFEQLERVLHADKVAIEAGDMVCFHTGFAQMIVEADGRPDVAALKRACAVLDGSDARLLQWITDSGVAALIADNAAIESVSGQGSDPHGAVLPLHEHCLVKNGIPLAELWQLTPLAAWLRSCGRSRFLLTAPPLRLAGATGSPVTPIATV